ncbi:MAG UNVERIFIED_CONTAM: hypothetical protein LVR18_29690 [Planctomycetaceae bacterium]
MQGRHDEASRTLCLAEAMPGATQPAAAICLLMEQARLLHQAEKATDACPLFIRAFHFAHQHSMDGLAVDAAHMVAITADEPDAQVRWNETALDLARNSADPKATAWISVLHNNLAQAFIADSQFTAALNAFNTCREIALAENNSIVERGARWGIALRPPFARTNHRSPRHAAAGAQRV